MNSVTSISRQALTKDETWNPDIPSGVICISRELADPELGGEPEPGIDRIDGDLGPDSSNFSETAADKLLESNGYLRTGPWIEGTMDGSRPSGNKYALTTGRSCTLVKIEDSESGV
jgi:hypothetical protein